MRLDYRLLTAATLIAAASHGGVCAPAHPTSSANVRIAVRNVLFHPLDDVNLVVTRLDGWMIPRLGGIVSLDKKNSFTLAILSGETHLTAADLSALMNEYVLPHAHSSIKNIAVSFEGPSMVVKGDLKKGVPISFTAKGSVMLDGTDAIRVHFTEIRAAGLLKKGLLDFLGIKLSKVAQPGKTSRFHIEGDDVILPINALFPPPRISGKLTAVSIQGDSLVQIFGPPSAQPQPPPTPAKAYIYFRGGTVQFGNLSMSPVDLQLVDTVPVAQFDFSLDHYYEQLQAGYSKLLLGRGLLVSVPGYATLRAKKQ
jgi:hypothetical protein